MDPLEQFNEKRVIRIFESAQLKSGKVSLAKVAQEIERVFGVNLPLSTLGRLVPEGRLNHATLCKLMDHLWYYLYTLPNSDAVNQDEEWVLVPTASLSEAEQTNEILRKMWGD